MEKMANLLYRAYSSLDRQYKFTEKMEKASFELAPLLDRETKLKFYEFETTCNLAMMDVLIDFALYILELLCPELIYT